MNLDFVEAARSYLGTRWVHQGRSKAGIDCLGLVVRSAWDCGYDLVDCKKYRRRPDDKKLLHMVDMQMDRVSKDDIQPGDILLIFFNGRKTSPYHFAIVDKDPRCIIHGHAPHRKVIMDSIDSWEDQIHSVYRLPSK